MFQVARTITVLGLSIGLVATLVRADDENHRKEIGRLRGTVAQLKQEVNVLERALDEMLERESLIYISNDPAVMPDGKLTNVNADVVVINLGRTDRLLKGLRFEVYDSKRAVLPDKFGNYTGKATIEVIAIRDKDTLCRVVRRSLGERLAVGDVIGNVIYDPRATYQFYIWGRFDINRTGKPGKKEVKRVARLVEKWGGKAIVPDFSKLHQEDDEDRKALKELLQAGVSGLNDHSLEHMVNLLETRLDEMKRKTQKPSDDQLPWRFLSPDLDYVILGAAPDVTKAFKPAELNTLHRVTWNQDKIDYQYHKAIEKEARDLGIPILNQNRFLQMIGLHE